MIRNTARRVPVVVALLVLVMAGTALAQRFGRRFGRQAGREVQVQNEPYDGRFTFARVRYTTAPGGYWYGGLPSWAHGYPMSEDNLMRIMNEVTFLGARTDAYNAFALDDPEIMKYPVLYLTEAGWWTMTDREVSAFRAFLQKGGFIIFDDFKLAGDFGPGGGWEPFEENLRRVLPAARFVDLDVSHPIFHCFFEIDQLGNFPQAYNAGPPIFRGVYEDNDPRRRLQIVINYNTDVSQFWEWSGRGLRPFEQTNEAYKLGVNYVIYGLTH